MVANQGAFVTIVPPFAGVTARAIVDRKIPATPINIITETSKVILANLLAFMFPPGQEQTFVSSSRLSRVTRRPRPLALFVNTFDRDAPRIHPVYKQWTHLILADGFTAA